MTQYDYTLNIPFAADNPSVDQPNMEQNTNSTNFLIGEDHYTFNEPNGGLHTQVRLPNLAAAPSNSIAASCTLYSQLGYINSDLFAFPNVNPTMPFQLTLMDIANYTTFATYTQYTAPPVATTLGGWTFMAGGLRFQYGVAQVFNPNNSIKIVYPVKFNTAVYSFVTQSGNTLNRNFTALNVNGVGKNSAMVYLDSTPVVGMPTLVLWLAIGI